MAIWIIQALLAIAFGMTGLMKLTKSKTDLKVSGAGRMDWTEDLSQTQIKTIGALELSASLGLIAPQVTGLLPILTPMAATGLVLTMIGAITLHMRRGDGLQPIVTNLILLLVAASVAYGRFVLIPSSI